MLSTDLPHLMEAMARAGMQIEYHPEFANPHLRRYDPEQIKNHKGDRLLIIYWKNYGAYYAAEITSPDRESPALLQLMKQNGVVPFRTYNGVDENFAKEIKEDLKQLITRGQTTHLKGDKLDALSGLDKILLTA